jgi:hypothetical protein
VVSEMQLRVPYREGSTRMAQRSTRRLSPAQQSVNWLIQWVGIATTLIGAIAALLLAIGKFGDAAYAPCRPFPSLPWCTANPPKLAALDAGPVGGGHNQGEYCEPRAAAYRSQFPNYTISWKGSETSNKDLLGHVTYRYHCEFIATPNKRSFGLWVAIGGLTVGVLTLLFVAWRRRASRGF